ncbi:MAG: crossover junction endodeoxyribonuclease RuvC [Candidatus Doudnabacteria bacterium]
MVILGIDPGTATTGFGVIEKQNNKFLILEYGVINTDKSLPQAQRLQTIYDDLSLIIDKHQPIAVGIEKLFFSNNQKTAMTVSESRGVVLLKLQQKNIKIFEYTPLQVKNILCGYGQADKKQIQTMVQQTFGLQSLPKPDDAADALAIALCAGWNLK